MPHAGSLASFTPAVQGTSSCVRGRPVLAAMTGVALAVLTAWPTTALAQTTATRMIGAWGVVAEVDLLDDTRVVTLVTRPISRTTRTATVGLAALCSHTTGALTVGLVSFGSVPAGADGRLHVRLRFDDDVAGPALGWKVAPDAKQAFFLPDSATSSFVTAAARARRLVLRVLDPATGAADTFTYSLRGFSLARKSLRC